MPDAHDFQSAIEAAEHAAAAGDYMAAERHLSDAAFQQEASLGPLHPDLANTLNNLGVVYETNDKPGDAERCYRRAYAIAIAALAPDHPFVATSEKNLRDFCEASGKPFDLPMPLPETAQAAAAPEPVVAAPASAAPPLRAQTPEVAAPIDTTHPQPADPKKSPRFGAFAMLGVLVVASLVVMRMWLGGTGSGEAVQQTGAPPAERSTERAAADQTPPSAQAGDAPAAAAPAAAPDVVSPKPPVTSRPTPAAAPSRRAAAPPSRRAAAPPSSVRAAVVDANLCSSLSTASWRCSPVSGEAPAGVLFFYTRIKSPAAATVEHRWYLGDRLHRSVALRIQPNERSGFRTYSRTAVKPGNWRVELRMRGGGVLHEERFVVR